MDRWKRVSMNLDIVRVKSFFTVQTFNFSSSHTPGFPSQRVSISQSAKHYFRLPESRSRFMLKLKSYSFSSERIATFPGFCAYPATTITDGGFIFEIYHVYATYTHLRSPVCRVRAIAAEYSSVSTSARTRPRSSQMFSSRG